MLAIFNSLGGGEVIAILVIALIVLGPEKLPEAIRKFGNIYGELKRMSTGFQSELRDAFDEPLRELKGTAQMMQDAVNDPVQSVTTQMRAPVVGGAAAAAAASTAAADGAAAADEEVQAPVEEDAPAAAAEEAEVAVEEDAPAAAGEDAQAAVEEDAPPPAMEEPGPAAAPAAVSPQASPEASEPADPVAPPDDVVTPDGPTEQAG